jgi:dTDP-4-dehydrorhamnose 3,5-epimerase
LHVQMEPSRQVKLIRVVSGKIIDFVVDMGDAAKLVHQAEIGPEQDWVKIGADYAHGFFAVEDTIFEYVCDGGYDEANEKAFSIAQWLENELELENLILSEKDRASPPL